MNQYTYSNCFELINNNNNISDYLFDSSFSNQPINNESDCADYAYYNNHPSFFPKLVIIMIFLNVLLSIMTK